MQSLDFLLLVQQERYKDLLREAEHERLIRAAGLRQPGDRRLDRKVANRIGAQMIRWGYELQRYATTSSPSYQVGECQ